MNSKLKSSTVRRLAVVIVVLAILAGGFFLLKSSAFSKMLAKAGDSSEELEIASRTMTFGVDAAGTLRATSVRNFSGPPPFGNYWQFQIVSMAPEGQNVKSGDLLITFDAQKVQQDLQSLRSELDSATKELEKTQVSIDLERQELSAKLAAAENNYEKCKLKQGVSSDIEASSVIEKDGLDLEQARREVEALKERLEWHTKSSQATYNIIQSRKVRAQNKVDAIQKGMEGFQAKADRDGVVVYKVKWNGERYRVGENIWSGEPVMEIPESAIRHRNDVVAFKHPMYRTAYRRIRATRLYPWARRHLGRDRVRRIRAAVTRQATLPTMAEALDTCADDQRDQLEGLERRSREAVRDVLAEQDRRTGLRWESAWQPSRSD